MKKIITYINLIFLFLASCIDPFDAKLTTNERKLVVEAWLTNEAPPYTVRLYFSSPYNNKDLNIPVAGAKVFVSDNLGNKIDFEESPTTRGFYQSSPTGARGQEGRIYTLNIRTSNDQLYQSKPELLRPSTPIDSVFSAFKEKIDERGIKTRSFDVLVESKDPANTENYYKWEAVRYESLQYCINRIAAPTPTAPPTRFLANCCQPCWTVIKCQGCILLGDDKLVNGNKIRKTVGSVPYNSRLDAYVLVKQYAISKDVHSFWMAVDGQVNNSGGIFDEPPTTIRGNIFNTNKPDEQVLGFFGAAGVSIKPTFVKRNYVSTPPVPEPDDNLLVVILRNCEPCEERSNRTGKKPPNWF